MRRRDHGDSPVEPPSRLRCYDAASWLPLVDLNDYDPDRYRNRGPAGYYGEPYWTLGVWRDLEAHQLWRNARFAWMNAHGWPGGMTVLDLLREEAGVRREQSRQRLVERGPDHG